MHASDCATNNGPALPVGPCDCGGAIPAPVAPDMPARTVALLARIAALEAALAPFADAAGAFSGADREREITHWHPSGLRFAHLAEAARVLKST